jgi:hypothetical protein
LKILKNKVGIMKFIYIDESGDLGIKGSKYIIISAIILEDTDELNRIIKNMRRNKFKKELKNINEIKGYACSHEIIRYLLKKINKTNSKICTVIFNKRKCYKDFDKNNLYNKLVGILAEHLKINSDLTIRIDRSKANTRDMEIFNKYFEKKLNLRNEFKLKIFHSYSHEWDGLQIIDVIAWSYFQKYENQKSEFVDMIKLEAKTIEVN